MARAQNVWRTRFALFPTRMDNGRLVWLRSFEEIQTTLRSTRDDVPFLVIRRRLPPERMIP